MDPITIEAYRCEVRRWRRIALTAIEQGRMKDALYAVRVQRSWMKKAGDA